MNTKTLPLIAIGIAALAGGLCMQPAQAAPKPAIKKAAPLPEIWQKLTPGQRLPYVRAAELDATRIFAERIMGISLDGESTVRDLAAASDSVKGQIATTLRGVKTTESPTYHDDGRVEVVRAVKVRSLIESIRKISGKEGAEATQSATVEEIDALGNAAIPGSLGHSRVMAKRAAELDVYRRLAERACGIQITAESTMRDFVVSRDTLKTSFSNTLKSAEITGINFNDDGPPKSPPA